MLHSDRPGIHHAGFFVYRAVALLLLLSAAASPRAAAQSTPFEIDEVTVTVDGDFTPDQLAEELVTQPTPWGPLVYLNENISSSFGAPRRFYDPLVFYNDVRHLHDFFNDQGYFAAVIDTLVEPADGGRRVRVGLAVRTGPRSLIDSLSVAGLPADEPVIAAEADQMALLRVGDPFLRPKVFEEQNRIIALLHSNGYPSARVDSVSLRRYASTNNVAVFIRIDHGPRTAVGATTVTVNGGDVIDSAVILRQMDFREGERYSEPKRAQSEENLNRLGIFENATVRSTFVPDSSGSATASMSIAYRTLEFQEVTPEFLVLSENNELFSVGLGLAYKHRNFLGGAQNLTITARGRVNRLEELHVPGVLENGLSEPTLFSKADLQSQLTFPYFFSNRNTASIALATEGEKQPDYQLRTLRARFAFTTKFDPFTTGITEFSIERVDPQFTVPQNVRPEDSTKQFNFIEGFTLQWNHTNRIFSPTAGSFHSVSVEEAGLVSKAVGGFQLPYSEYVKLSAVGKYFLGLSADRTRILAVKVQGGIAHLYNPSNTTPVPLPRRFFAGGSASVRAWKDKQLSSFGTEITGGNVAVEGSIESRTQLFPDPGTFLFLSLPNIWSVVFLDFGNTWYRPSDLQVRDVALAVGAGLRYETFVGPFRFDVAWRLYDPNRTDGREWLTEQSFFNGSFAVVHFGIGHAF